MAAKMANQKRFKTIVGAIRDGLSRQAASSLAGICPRTLYLWQQRGRKGEKPYDKFIQDMDQAEAELERKVVTVWMSAIPEDWRAAKDFLSRRFPWWSNAGAKVLIEEAVAYQKGEDVDNPKPAKGEASAPSGSPRDHFKVFRAPKQAQG